METKTKIGIAVVAISGAFAVGRYSAPEKIRVEKQVVEVEKKTEQTKTDTDRDKHRETTVTETVKQDGTKQTVTRTVEDTRTERRTDQKQFQQDTRVTTETKEVTKSGRHITLAALSGVSVWAPSQVFYGGQVTTSLLGPITVGVWGLSNGTAGASLGLQF